MWRRPKLVSLAFLFGGRPKIIGYSGEGGRIGQESTGLAELVDACTNTLCTSSFKIKYVPILHHTCSFARFQNLIVIKLHATEHVHNVGNWVSHSGDIYFTFHDP